MAVRWGQTLGSFRWALPPPPTLLQGFAALQLSAGARETVPGAGEALAGSS